MYLLKYLSQQHFVNRFCLVWVISLIATTVFSEICPSDFAAYSRGQLNIGSNVTVNGTPVTSNSGGNLDGINPTTGALVNQNPTFTLPDLNPSSFPSNNSNTDSSASTIAAGDYDKITVTDNSTTTFTGGTYNIDKLEAGEDATIILAPGIYYINELELEEGSRLIISPSGSVQIFINDSVEIGEDANINTGGLVANLTFLLYNNADFEADEDVTFVGIIYSPFNSSDIEFGEDANITGGLITNGKIDLDGDTNLSYGPAEEAAVLAIVPCATGLDHIEITHDGNALTCQAENITVKACANSDCSSLFTADVSVTVTPTGWLGGDTQTITNGIRTFSLAITTAGTYTLGVSSSGPSASNSPQCVNSGAGNTRCDIIFFDTGFVYDVPNLTSCATSASVTLSAVNLSDALQACVPTFQNTTKTVNFWSIYSSPASGSNQVVLNNGSMNFTLATASPGTGVALNFDANGQANITVTYSDAGQLSLNSNYTSGNVTLTGGDSFITVPAKLYVYSDDTDAACATNDATCSPYVSAGDNFNLKIRAACSDNSVTPNFALTTIAVTHTNTAPALAQGTLGISSFDMASGDSGDHTISTQTVSEVGVFTFTATSPNYLGVTGPLGTSTFLGRFIPDHFCVSSSTLSNRTDNNTSTRCSDGFSYLSEDFTNSFTLTAQQSSATCGDGSSTTNYSARFSKFNTTNLLSGDNTSDATETGVLNIAAIDSTTSLNLSSRINFNTSASTSSGAFTSGSLSVNAQMDINRSGNSPGYTAETAFTDVDIGIKPIDRDNVGLDSTNLMINSVSYYNTGSTALFFGRLIAENAFGTNQTDVGLDMYARVEYCSAVTSGTCTGWAHKTDDSCSLYNINPPTGVQLGSSAATIGTPGYYLRVSPTISSATFNFDDPGTATSYARVHVPDTNGHSAGWRLFYTAGGNGGNFTIPLNFPFNSDTSTHPYLLHIDGIASFGQFRGDDRIIFWREVLE